MLMSAKLKVVSCDLYIFWIEPSFIIVGYVPKGYVLLAPPPIREESKNKSSLGRVKIEVFYLFFDLRHVTKCIYCLSLHVM